MNNYNYETIVLLNQLGLTRDGPNRDIYYNFLSSYIKLDTTAHEVNTELKQMLLVLSQANTKAKRLISDQGLKTIAISQGWDKYYKCYVQTYILDNKQKIEIKINNAFSNNNWNPNDIQRMYDSKFAAAGTNTKTKATANKIKKKYDHELKEIQANFYKQPLKATIESTKNLHQRIIQELIKITPDLQRRENKLLAAERRPIIITAYPQTSGWLMETNIPKTDLPSGIRDYKIKQISNYWKVNITTFKFDKNNQISIGKKRNFFRSSSIAQLDVDKPDRKLELEVLQDLIQNLACQKIINDILKKQAVNKSYTIKFAPTTLLSALINKEHGQKLALLSKNLAGTFVEGNEMEQLISIEKAFDGLDKIKNIKLSDKNIEYIITEVTNKNLGFNTSQLKQKLKQANIKQVHHAFNIPVNKIGSTPMERLDLLRFSYNYNSRNTQKLTVNMREYLNEHKIQHKELDLLLQTKITQKNWPELKQQYKALIFNTKDIKLNDKLTRMVDSFVRFQDHIQFIPSNNSRVTNGFMAGLYLFELNQLLGFTNHVTCKSGKDRTGLFVMLYQALADGDKQELLDNLAQAIKFSSAKDLNERNAPGCRGIQIDNDILDGLREIYGTNLKALPQSIEQLLKQQYSRPVGSMHKSVYKKPKNTPIHKKSHRI